MFLTKVRCHRHLIVPNDTGQIHDKSVVEMSSGQKHAEVNDGKGNLSVSLNVAWQRGCCLIKGSQQGPRKAFHFEVAASFPADGSLGPTADGFWSPGSERTGVRRCETSSTAGSIWHTALHSQAWQKTWRPTWRSRVCREDMSRAAVVQAYSQGNPGPLGRAYN